MPNSSHTAFHSKIVNPELAAVAMHGNEMHGEFKALVRLAKPEKHPSGVKMIEIHSSNLFKVRIRCDQIEHLVSDCNVVSVELQEYISKGGREE